ncbi:hypothetical protein BD779DRAFT_693378 [Infundibulicybe gibba]|nr:hypothetical protein BD779DRAFT_693378 [Infundibulicybe gibba]
MARSLAHMMLEVFYSSHMRPVLGDAAQTVSFRFLLDGIRAWWRYFGIAGALSTQAVPCPTAYLRARFISYAHLMPEPDSGRRPRTLESSPRARAPCRRSAYTAPPRRPPPLNPRGPPLCRFPGSAGLLARRRTQTGLRVSSREWYSHGARVGHCGREHVLGTGRRQHVPQHHSGTIKHASHLRGSVARLRAELERGGQEQCCTGA